MPPADQKLAQAIHTLVMSLSPKITTRTWYGMPAYYVNDTIVCFFQAGSKFESRYSTFGFQDAANLDDGSFWPTSFAVTAMNDAVKKEIASHKSNLLEGRNPSQVRAEKATNAETVGFEPTVPVRELHLSRVVH